MASFLEYKIFCLTERNFVSGVIQEPIFPRCPNHASHQVISSTLTLIRIYREGEQVLYNIGFVHGGDTGVVINYPSSTKEPIFIGSLFSSADTGTSLLQVNNSVINQVQHGSRLTVDFNGNRQDLGNIIGINALSHTIVVSGTLQSFYPPGSSIFLTD